MQTAVPVCPPVVPHMLSSTNHHIFANDVIKCLHDKLLANKRYTTCNLVNEGFVMWPNQNLFGGTKRRILLTHLKKLEHRIYFILPTRKTNHIYKRSYFSTSKIGLSNHAAKYRCTLTMRGAWKI